MKKMLILAIISFSLIGCINTSFVRSVEVLKEKTEGKYNDSFFYFVDYGNMPHDFIDFSNDPPINTGRIKNGYHYLGNDEIISFYESTQAKLFDIVIVFYKLDSLVDSTEVSHVQEGFPKLSINRVSGVQKFISDAVHTINSDNPSAITSDFYLESTRVGTYYLIDYTGKSRQESLDAYDFFSVWFRDTLDANLKPLQDF